MREGQSIKLKVTLDGATSVATWVSARAVRGDGENLRGTDVPRDWLNDHGDSVAPRRTLWRLYVSAYDEIPSRKDTTTLEFPVRQDGVREGAEFLYVRLDVGQGNHARYRIKVLDAD